MIGNRTFTMIKPDAVENGHIGAILEKITGA
ncbi:MAG: nucleoside-diphosphate kinase, partial [Bacteroidota bacterium]